MKSGITGLTRDEAEFLSILAAADLAVFRVEDVRALWPDTSAIPKILSRLSRGGWLKRLERQLYMLVPLEAGPERTWSEDALVIGTRLLKPGAIAYWSALRFWNLTEQMPRTVFVQGPQRKLHPILTVVNVRYQFVYIRRERFFGVTQTTIAGQPVAVTDREKTLIDALDRPEFCGGVEPLAAALRDNWQDFDWDTLDHYLLQFNSGAVYKRLGYLCEHLALPLPQQAERLQSWRARLSSGIALLDPSEPANGRIRTRWRVRDNLNLFVKAEAPN
jgi:predicted transcriptional regulator of viral defense system